MRRIIILMLFIFLSLPCLAEDVIYLDKQSDKNAAKILYEYALKEVNMTPQKAYEAFGYRLSDIKAVFYDLNSDGVDEIIGYIAVPSSYSQDGACLYILKKDRMAYMNICMVNTHPWKGIWVLDSITNGFRNIRVYPTIELIQRRAIYDKKQQSYIYFFPD